MNQKHLSLALVCGACWLLAGWHFTGVASGAVAVAAQDPLKEEAKKTPTKSDRELIQGEWQVEAAQKRGKPHPRLIGDRLTFEGEKLAIRPKDGDNVEGQFRLRSEAKPKEIDLMMHIGEEVEVLKGIYQFAEEKLQMTFAPPGMARPSAFDTKESEEYIGMVLKKNGEKKEK